MRTALKVILLAIWLYGPTYIFNNYFVKSEHNLAFVGGLIRARGAKRQKKRLKRRRDEAGTISDRIEAIREDKPELEVDREGITTFKNVLADNLSRARSETARSQYDVATAGGAPAGDELQRDENRRSTANSISRAMNTIGGGSSALGAIALAEAQERAGNRRINIDSTNRIENNIQAATNRRQNAIAMEAQAAARQASGLFDANQFETDADILEYQENELNPYLQATADDRSLTYAIDQSQFQITEALAQTADDFIANRRAKRDQAVKLATLGIAG